MGLFDYLKIQKKLPTDALLKQFLGKDFDLSSLEYQTKDLENAMLTYEIRKNGDLYYEQIEYRESTPEEKAQDKEEADKNKFFAGIRLREKSRQWVKTDITRDVNFYSYTKHKDGRYYSIDYTAKFVNGRAKTIKLLKTERESDQEYADRLQQEAKWAEEMRQHQKKINSISYKVINNVYNIPVRKAIRLARKGTENFSKLLYGLERKILY